MPLNSVCISIVWLDAYCYTVRQSTTVYYKSFEATGWAMVITM